MTSPPSASDAPSRTHCAPESLMNEPTTIVVKNQLCELERVSRAVAEFGARRALPAEVIFAGSLALDEILTNVISYGYEDAAEHEILVRLEAVGGMLTVVVEDDGRPFNPLAAAPVDTEAAIEDRAVGGLGIHLVREVMDDLAYRREAGKNVMVMKKSIVVYDAPGKRSKTPDRLKER